MDTDYTVYLQKSNLVQIKILNPDRSTPVANASISINRLDMGTTNSAGVLHVSMGRGTYHHITASAETHEPYSSSQDIETNQASPTIILSKSYLTPLVLVYDTDKKPIATTTVIIDGKTTVYPDEYGKAQFPRHIAGIYDLEVTKVNYAPCKKDQLLRRLVHRHHRTSLRNGSSDDSRY
ncbi:MAG: hypothetical protein LBU24_03830 [Methanocalculaceae archaeon]|jgi:hypothetical protein|nr:hypothetical protein [Methanocalculaceae archaeon]